MEISPNIQKYLVIGVAVVIVIILLILILPGAMSSGTINASFEKTSLTAGETTDLSVTVTNTIGEDVSSLEVSIEAFSTNIMVGNSPQTEELVGKGESRKFTFPITVAEDARPGSYSIGITAKLGSEEETIRVNLEVEE